MIYSADSTRLSSDLLRFSLYTSLLLDLCAYWSSEGDIGTLESRYVC